MTAARLRLAVAVLAAVTVAALYVQAVVLRPRQWPAGVGMTLSGDSLMLALAEPASVTIAQLPDLRSVLGQPITIVDVWPGGEADLAALKPGAIVTAVEDAEGHRVDIGPIVPANTGDALTVWRDLHRLSPVGPLTFDVRDGAGRPDRRVTLDRPAVWSAKSEVLDTWLRAYHLGPLLKQLVYTLAALLVIALGARGASALLLTLAFLFMGASDAGLLMGAELDLPAIGPLLLVFTWVVTAMAFPVIGIAVLHFPTRAPLLDRHRWVLPALFLVPVPLASVGVLTALFLLGVPAAGPAVAWVADRPWVLSTSFGLGLAINIALVVEGVHRYRINPDAAERHRIETVVFTAVPGLTAYTLLTALPMAADTMGASFRWPVPIANLLHLVVLLSAVGFAYAVAVRRALSPRTVLRQGLQYAMARRTLGLLTALPAMLLVVSLASQRDQALSAIISGRPLFYLGSIVLIGLGIKYRHAAQRWLDLRFFRVEYDAREILLSLASRVPYETDPRALVTLVLTGIESALHPESAAVMTAQGGHYDVIHALGRRPAPLPSNSGLAQLLRWSDAPLEVLLDDDRAPTGRLPAADREWLAACGATLIVPVIDVSDVERPLLGLIVLGPKRSEEPFTSEDRKLLAGIVAQMHVALDMSRLRRQAGSTPGRGLTSTPTIPPARTPAQTIDVGMTIDDKYRVDTLIGRGGMGAVFKARDLRLERDVAVKVVRSELVASPDARERFRREAQMAARLHHPAIVTVFDYGTLPDGAAYLVMEYVRGEDLRARLLRGPLDPATSVHLLAGVADGVDAAHRESVLHRDLKPENVLLQELGGGPKVLDFGVAKMMEVSDQTRPLTLGGTVVGTPSYMAPEQLRGEPVDARTDVYSLAVMGYEMLTGRLPYGAGSFVDVALRQSSPASGIEMTAVPDAVATVLRRALSYAREERPASAAAFATELRQALVK